MWNGLISHFIENKIKDDKFSFLFLNMDTILRNLSYGDFAYIWHGEQVGIIMLKFQINRQE